MTRNNLVSYTSTFQLIFNVKIVVNCRTHMQRIPVTSSDIASIGYQPETRTLEIEFHSQRSIYQYFNVPEQEYNELMNAGSHGKYFHRFIKNKYSYEKIS